MAAYISVPRDLSRVKSKILFNLTKRQLLCFGAAALIGVPSFFLLKKVGSVSMAAICMIVIMLPLFFLGMVHAANLTPEQLAQIIAMATQGNVGAYPEGMVSENEDYEEEDRYNDET